MKFWRCLALHVVVVAVLCVPLAFVWNFAVSPTVVWLQDVTPSQIATVLALFPSVTFKAIEDLKN